MAKNRDVAEQAQRTVDMAALEFRAAVQSVNEEDRTVEVTWTTGAAVERVDWVTGKRYLEVLSLDPAHIRLDRLNAGGPLLDGHMGGSVRSTLGAVVPGSVVLQSKRDGRARIKFSRRPEVEGVWQDVRDGLVRSVSVGYRVYRYEEKEGKGNALPVRTATDWEPVELSLVPIPADAGARVRGGEKVETYPCQIVKAPRTAAEGAHMDNVSPEYLDERAAEQPAAPAASATPTEPNERDLGATAERQRVQDILTACRAARLPQAFADKLIAEGIGSAEAQRRVFAELNARGGDAEGPGRIPSGPRVEVVGEDPAVHKRAGVANSMLHRIAPHLFKLDDNGRQYRGLSMIDVARVFLHSRGQRTSNLGPLDVLSSALGPGAVYVYNERTGAMETRGGMHTTSDFALLLADVQGKALRAMYAEAPQTWAPITRTVTLRDFKPSRQLQTGPAPDLDEVLENGEFTRGTMLEAKEQFQLATYGKVFGISRQALVNDDLGAFGRVAEAFARAARRKENALAWAQITGNPAMWDRNNLFDDTNHGNYTSSGAAINVTSLGVGRAKLRKQTDLDGTTPLNLSARFLIVGPDKETEADQYVSAIAAALGSSVNPFAQGGRTPLSVICEALLTGNTWYLATSPDQCDVLLRGVLEGQEGPAIETRVGFDVDGVETKCRIDTAFKIADWRGIYKNAGA